MNAYEIGSAIVFWSVFIGSWIYCAVAYGFLLGVGLGWLPSVIVAWLAALLWPLLLIILIPLAFLIFKH